MTWRKGGAEELVRGSKGFKDQRDGIGIGRYNPEDSQLAAASFFLPVSSSH